MRPFVQPVAARPTTTSLNSIEAGLRPQPSRRHIDALAAESSRLLGKSFQHDGQSRHSAVVVPFDPFVRLSDAVVLLRFLLVDVSHPRFDFGDCRPRGAVQLGDEMLMASHIFLVATDGIRMFLQPGNLAPQGDFKILEQFRLFLPPSSMSWRHILRSASQCKWSA